MTNKKHLALAAGEIQYIWRDMRTTGGMYIEIRVLAQEDLVEN